MRCPIRFTRGARLATLIAGLCPTLQDVVTEALSNVFTDHVPAAASTWLAIPVGLLASAVLERLFSLVYSARK